jgi:hypothetical protein
MMDFSTTKHAKMMLFRAFWKNPPNSRAAGLTRLRFRASKNCSRTCRRKICGNFFGTGISGRRKWIGPRGKSGRAFRREGSLLQIISTGDDPWD